jgi:hypothetical protein
MRAIRFYSWFDESSESVGNSESPVDDNSANIVNVI